MELATSLAVRSGFYLLLDDALNTVQTLLEDFHAWAV
jgi:hypothetical protein